MQEQFKKLVKAVEIDVENMGSVIKQLRLIAFSILILAACVILLQIEILIK